MTMGGETSNSLAGVLIALTIALLPLKFLALSSSFRMRNIFAIKIAIAYPVVYLAGFFIGFVPMRCWKIFLFDYLPAENPSLLFLWLALILSMLPRSIAAAFAKERRIRAFFINYVGMWLMVILSIYFIGKAGLRFEYYWGG